MSLSKLFNRIFFHNNTTPALDEDNLNAMSKAINDIDDRVINLAGTIMEDVPQIQEDIEELEEDFELIDGKITEAQAAAASAQNSANAAVGSVTSAQQKALIAEGWAKGTQNGSPVSQSSPYWQNNAEYWAGKARSFTPEGYQDLVDDVEDVKQTLSDLTDTVEDTEPYALRQAKGNMVDMSLVGGSIAWNQLQVNGNFANTSNWASTSSSFSVSNNVAHITATGQWGRINSANIYMPSNHKMLYFLTAKGSLQNYCQFSNLTLHYFTTTNRKTYGYFEVGDGNNHTLNIGDSRTSGWTEFTVENVMCFDLTQMFGSTIADYIYSLEQATAGAGVAWFRQYFSDSYYAYDSGSIKSVNPVSRKVVVSKNIATTEIYKNNYVLSLTGNETSSSGYIITDIILVEAETYYVSFKKGIVSDPDPLRVGIYDNDMGFITRLSVPSNGAITIPSNGKYLRLTYCVDTAQSAYMYDVQIVKGGIEIPYEPYKTSTYPFDSTLQLRGIPKLVNNKLSYDGDIYTADGTVTRKYGIVDLGTLTWSYEASLATPVFSSSASVINAKLQQANIVCPLYTPKTTFWSQSGNDMCIAVGDGALNISNSAYTDAAAFKTAMSGVYAVYELATPTTETSTPFQNPQRAFIDGTEEFIYDSEVTVPVGHNSTYYLNETLPQSEDYTDGAVELLKNGKIDITALGTDESGRTTASRAYTTGEFFYMDGKMYKVTTSIANGATFTIGTNCTQTTLFAELTALA